MLGRRMMMSAGAAVYRYFRIDITANNGGTFVALVELEWMVDITAYPTENMTSNTAPSPLVSSGSTDNNGAPWKGFDGITATGMWGTNDGQATGWLKIDLGAGNEIVATSVKLTMRSANSTEAPKDFTLEGSNTGAFSGEETVLKTVTSETGWGTETREYTF